MLPYGIDYAVFEDRHKQHLREAEKRWLIQQLRVGQRGSGRFSPVLLWLSRRLVAWGQLLEDYAVARPATQAGSRC